MPSSRLFRSIVVFGASLGVASGIVGLTANAGCDFIDPGPAHHGKWPVIDAGWGTIADAPNFCDGRCPDGWGIIDAANPDAYAAAAPEPS
jgi:hypothetical protein